MNGTVTCSLIMRLTKKYLVSFITLVVALQLLNLSIYAQDFKPLYASNQTGETNITETIVEYVVEVVLDHKNAIPEQSQHHAHKKVVFKAIGLFPEYTVAVVQDYSPASNTKITDSYTYLYLQEINPPPPKA